MTLTRFSALATIVCAGTLAYSGCIAAETETEDPTFDDQDEDEAIATATDALDAHDGRPGSEMGPSPECMRACRQSLYACVQACDFVPPGEESACRRRCADAYLNCTSMCATGGHGGCNSLNSVDCSPWWHGRP